ncbi:hypothetical protein RHGRI_026186 [Rhododendron griersonianum]|uniref:Uncharacterized protein n=1 Tax=Rhododendron griersonianum TaxID=479676 RepID=A0AAV6IRR5_9ERIC|nr:hypothetical protein RHGRI_026186 [Rhododendron griersonianum]
MTANPPQMRNTRIKSIRSRNFAVSIFCAILIFSHLIPSSSHPIPLSNPNRSTTSRKSRFLNGDDTTTLQAANGPSDAGSSENGNGVEDNTRVVQTGPNPLHN